MVHVGWIYADIGTDADAELIGVTDDVSGLDTGDGSTIVELNLTDDQAATARAAYLQYRVSVDNALRMIDEARGYIKDARAAFDEATMWLKPLYDAEVRAQDEREREEYRVRRDAAAKAREDALAAQDAELGPRLFITTERPPNEVRKLMYGHTARLRLHRRYCNTAHKDPAVARQDGMRMVEACELYFLGAITCGVCKPDDLMVTDPVDGARVDAERLRRESAPVTLTPAAVRKSIHVDGVRWKNGALAGLTLMSKDSFPDVVKHAHVIGWKDPGKSWAEQIPGNVRDLVYQAAAANKWHVEWNTQPNRGGYLVVRAMTKAEIRRARDGR